MLQQLIDTHTEKVDRKASILNDMTERLGKYDEWVRLKLNALLSVLPSVESALGKLNFELAKISAVTHPDDDRLCRMTFDGSEVLRLECKLNMIGARKPYKKANGQREYQLLNDRRRKISDKFKKLTGLRNDINQYSLEGDGKCVLFDFYI